MMIKQIHKRGIVIKTYASRDGPSGVVGKTVPGMLASHLGAGSCPGFPGFPTF